MRTLRLVRDWLSEEVGGLQRRVGWAALLAYAALCLVLLLIVTLIQMGVLKGWGDLVRDVSPADA